MSPEETRLDTAVQAFRDAEGELLDAAVAYARAQAVLYSSAHPRRKVQFVACMGASTLFVSRGGTCYGEDYQISYGRPGIGNPPAFIDKLGDLESEFKFSFALGGDLNVTCRAGEIISEPKDW